MKRDMELVRALLLAVEGKGDEYGSLFVNAETDRDALGLADYSAHQLMYHLGLLQQAGFVEGSALHGEGAGEFNVERLTWAGHEFLDDVRDPKIWKLTKEGAKQAGIGSVALIGELAKGYAKQMAQSIGLPLP